MTEFIKAFAEDSEGENVLNGMFASWQGIVAIILLLVGAAMIYMGIKVMHGYKIDFSTTASIPQEDIYLPVSAKIQNRTKTVVPNFNGGGEQTFIEWTMVYEVEGEKFKQTIPDKNYEKGQLIDIKYNPDNPSEYYLFDKAAEQAKAAEQENEEVVEEPQEKNKLGVVIIIVAVFIIAMAGALLADNLL